MDFIPVQLHLTRRQAQLILATRIFLIRNLNKISWDSVSTTRVRRKQQPPQDEEEMDLRQERLESLTDKLQDRVRSDLSRPKTTPKAVSPASKPPMSSILMPQSSSLGRSNTKSLTRPPAPVKKSGIILIQPLLNGNPENRATVQPKSRKSGSRRRKQDGDGGSSERRHVPIPIKRPRRDVDVKAVSSVISASNSIARALKVQERSVRASTKKQRKMVISSSEDESVFEDDTDQADVDFDSHSVLPQGNSTSGTRRTPNILSKILTENDIGSRSAPTNSTEHPGNGNFDNGTSNWKAPKDLQKTTMPMQKREARVVDAVVGTLSARRNVETRAPSAKPSAFYRPPMNMLMPITKKPSVGENMRPHNSSHHPNTPKILECGEPRINPGPGLPNQMPVQTVSPVAPLIKKKAPLDKARRSTMKPRKSSSGNHAVKDADNKKEPHKHAEHPSQSPFDGLRPRPLLFLDKHFIRTHKCFLTRNYRKIAQKEWEGIPIGHTTLNVGVKSYLTMDKETFATKRASLEECVAQVVNNYMCFRREEGPTDPRTLSTKQA